MKSFSCDGCGEPMEFGVSGIIAPGIEEKEFCCYECVQQYMEEMEGKEQIGEYFCEKCNKKLGLDYCKFATEAGRYIGGFYSGRNVKFCSITCMIEWIKRERRGVTQHIYKETGRAPVCTYSNPELGNLRRWQIHKEGERLYVKPKLWDELLKKRK